MTNNDEAKRKKNIVFFMSIFGFFLVAMVVAAVTFPVNVNSENVKAAGKGGNSDDKSKAGGTSKSSLSNNIKAIKNICQPTDYKEKCVETLQSTAGNTTEPKELIRAAFNATINQIKNATKYSSTLRELEKDPTAKKALDGCKDLMDQAVEELQRSIDGLKGFEVHKLDKTLADLETWLSATITYQETCLDGFEEVKSDSGEKLKSALKTSMELSSNAIAIVAEISSVFDSLNFTSVNSFSGSRRLLQEDYGRTRMLMGTLDPTDENDTPGSVAEGRKLSMLKKAVPFLKGIYKTVKKTFSELNRPPPHYKLLQEEKQIFVGLEADSTKVNNDHDDRRRRRLLSSDDKSMAEKILEAFKQRISSRHLRRHLLLQDALPRIDREYSYPVWLDIMTNKRSQGNYLPILEDDHVSMESGNRRRLLRVANPVELKPDIVVAKDGSGDFTKINDALLHLPKKSNKTTIVYIKEGVYNEIVVVDKTMTHVYMIGDGGRKTRVTGSRNHVDGYPTMLTATFTVLGEFFMAKNIGFENTAGPEKHQAVALRVDADHAIFHNCSMDGYQDTLYTHAKRQYYRDCTISGTIDFVFGDAAAVFQNCKFVIRKPLDNQRCMVTAQGRKDRHETTGIVIHNSEIVADPEYYPYREKMKSYLGRPWKDFSRTIVMESFIDDSIQVDGWLPWEGNVRGVYLHTDTCYYGEFENYGPGASKIGRAKWPGIKEITRRQARGFTPRKFINGDSWVGPSKVPYHPGFFTTPNGKGRKIKS